MAGRDPLNSIADIAALQAEADKVIAVIRGIDEAVKSVGQVKSIYKDASGSAEQKKASEDLVQANKAVEAAQKQLNAEQQKGVTLQSELAKQIAVVREQNKQRTKEITAEAREAAGLNDAYKKLELQYNEAQRAAKNLAATQGLNSEEAKAAAENAKALSDQLKAIDSAVGQNQRNVGNYTGALQTLETELTRVREEIAKTKNAQASLIASGPSTPASDQSRIAAGAVRVPQAGDIQAVANYNAQLQQTTATISDLEKQEQLLNTIVSNQARGFNSVMAEIRSTERALFTLQEAGMQNTEAFQAMQEKLSEAKRELREFKDTQKLLSAEMPAVAAMTLAVKGLAGAYAIGAGAVQLFANGDEKVEKELNKLVAVMTILQGLNEVHELLEKKNTVAKIASATATGILTAAQRLYTFALEGSTIAANALRITLLSTGIGAVIVLIVAFISSMKDMKSATLEQLEAQNKLNDALKEFYEIMIKNNEELSERLSETTKELKDQLEIATAMGQNQYELFALRKQIAEDEKKNAKEALDDLGLTEAGIERLRIQHDQLNEKLQKNLDLKAKATKVDLGSSDMKYIDAQTEGYKKQLETLDGRIKRGDDLIKQINDSDQALKVLNVEQAKFGSEDVNKRQIEGVKGRLGEGIKFAQKIADLEGLALNTRLGAREKVFELERQLIINQRDFELSNISLTENQRATIIDNSNRSIREAEEKKIGDLLRIEGQYRANLQAEEKQITDMFIKEQEERAKEIEDATKAANERRIASIEESRDILISALDKQYADGKISEQEYQDQRKKLETDADIFILKARQDLLKADIDLAKANGKDHVVLDAQYANLEKQINDKKNQAEIDSDKAVLEKKKELKQQEIELEKKAAETVADTIKTFVEAAYEKELNSIQDQIEANTKLKDAELTRINQSTLSEQDKAAKIAQINADAQVKQDQLQQKQKEIKLKEAKFERDAALLNVGISTAQTVAKTLLEAHLLAANPLTAPLAAFAFGQVPIEIGIGAAQIAAILAKPLPRYATGTDYSPAGPAIVGEKGAELRIDPSGKVSLTPGNPTLTYLQEGTKIIPHDEVNQMMLHAMMQNTVKVPDREDMAAKEIRAMKQLMQWQHQELINAFARIISKNRTIIPPNYKDFGKDYLP